MNHFPADQKLIHCKLTILKLKKKKKPTTFEPINVRLNRHEKQKLCNDK